VLKVWSTRSPETEDKASDLAGQSASSEFGQALHHVAVGVNTTANSFQTDETMTLRRRANLKQKPYCRRGSAQAVWHRNESL